MQNKGSFAVAERVVVRGLAEGRLHTAIVQKVDSNGQYTVCTDEGGVHSGVALESMIPAPPSSEVRPTALQNTHACPLYQPAVPYTAQSLCVGARVGVRFNEKEEMYMGVVTGINKDGKA